MYRNADSEDMVKDDPPITLDCLLYDTHLLPNSHAPDDIPLPFHVFNRNTLDMWRAMMCERVRMLLTSDCNGHYLPAEWTVNPTRCHITAKPQNLVGDH